MSKNNEAMEALDKTKNHYQDKFYFTRKSMGPVFTETKL